ncbi:DNA methyltransferase [Halorussus salinisoli]|uniref:DNA methyltransferase n=1 Tax=Halorussus salinisoli TaxID=2558242 RepID=UPI0010C21DA6|nr:DNA methyltransferase [Halorussus salinisoli]
MQTFVTLQYEQETAIPSEYDDVRTPEAYVRHFLREFSEEGDVVFDPFAGFGTTLAVAEELGRVPHGVEFEADRVESIRDRIDHEENVVHGNALELDPGDFPAFDCCLTSPPYMEQSMGVNPFRNYADGSESDYETYLRDLTDLFARLADLAAPDASVLVDVSNMKYEGDVTTLAWDAAESVSESFHFEGEVVVGWEGEARDDRDGGTYGYGYDHSYCLAFSAGKSD